jgi:hypothetical protein
VNLARGKNPVKVGVHRLVAYAFYGEPAAWRNYACHKDGDRKNNVPENIYWGTPAENSADSIRHGTKPRGERCGVSKYTDGKVKQIRALSVLGVPDCEIARLHNMPHPTVRDIRRRHTWTHI